MQIIGFLILCGFFYWLIKPVKPTCPMAAELDRERFGIRVNWLRVLLLFATILAVAAVIGLLIVLLALAKHHLFSI